MDCFGVTVALSVSVSPFFIVTDFLFKVTFLAFFFLETTCTFTVFFLLPAFAVIVAVPVFLALIFPFFTVAIFLDEVDHTTLSVLFLGVMVAFTVTWVSF